MTSQLWKAISAPYKKFNKAKGKINTDVVIIGGGITGVTAAMELIKSGRRVALFEANRLGGATTGMSTGNLYLPIQPYYQTIVKNFDLETAKQVAISRQLAIDYIEKIASYIKFPCHFKRRPWFGYTNGENESIFSQEIETFKKMEIEIKIIKELPYTLPFTKAACLENQARFNPHQYVISLAQQVANQGGLILENSPIIDFKENGVCQLKTQDAEITAKAVFMATHTPLGINLTQMCTAPYRSYVVGAYLESENYPDAQLWEFDNSRHVLSAHAVNSDDAGIILVAGEHHKTGQGRNMRDHFSHLSSFLQQHLKVKDIAYRWSAQHFQSAKKLPYIGLIHRRAKNIYMATGFFADGLVYGTLAGLLVTHLITDKEDRFNSLYRPDGYTSLSAIRFISKENLNVFAQYLKDLPWSAANDFENLASNEGRIVEMDNEKCAVYRDGENKLHILSAVCTHMKCVVNWNNAEQTWDCPCHGSRFKPTGEVLEGPATINLAKKK